MTARIERRKHEKTVARRRRLAERAGSQAARAYRRQYPEVVFRPGDAPEGFVRLVREAVAAVRLDDRSRFTRPESREFARLRRDGYPVSPATAMRYGDEVFRAVPRDRMLAYLPLCDVTFGMTRAASGVARGALTAEFRALRRAKGPGGTVYYSAHEPKAEVGGRRLVVAFSGHAAARACERAVPTWATYGGMGDAFSLLQDTLEFEPCALAGGRIGFTFFENCRFRLSLDGTALPRSAGMALGVLGPDLDPGAPCAYRVGYCPAVVEGRFLKAKTTLFPGQRGTPEYELIRRHEPDPAERRRKWEEAERLDAAWLRRTRDYGLLRWFHGRGVPQVIHRHVRAADWACEGPCPPHASSATHPRGLAVGPN